MSDGTPTKKLASKITVLVGLNHTQIYRICMKLQLLFAESLTKHIYLDTIPCRKPQNQVTLPQNQVDFPLEQLSIVFPILNILRRLFREWVDHL